MIASRDRHANSLGEGLQILRPANLPLGWQQFTSNWRERARAATCVWSFACLSEDHKSFVPLQSSCKTMSQEFSEQVCAGGCDAQRYVGRVGAYKLMFARIERNPHRRRFASA